MEVSDNVNDEQHGGPALAIKLAFMVFAFLIPLILIHTIPLGGISTSLRELFGWALLVLGCIQLAIGVTLLPRAAIAPVVDGTENKEKQIIILAGAFISATASFVWVWALDVLYIIPFV